MAALEQEIAALLEAMGNSVTQHLIAGRCYYEGLIHDQPCVIVLSRVGKVAAASTTTTLINQFGVSQIIFTGLAGGLHPEAKIGDIVIAEELFQYDIDASPLFPRYSIPLLDTIFFKSDEKLNELINNITQHYLANDWARRFNTEQKETFFQRSSPQLHRGLIGSGDLFVHRIEQQEEILRAMPATLCVEMEGAAVAQVCYEYEVPFAIFRIISDRADSTARGDFNDFLNEVAPNYASAIVMQLLREINR